jgi:hypothetical protein
MVILTTTQQSIDFSGLGFYLDNRSKFYADDYAEFTGIDVDDIDLDSIKSVIDAANDLPDGKTVKIEHF